MKNLFNKINNLCSITGHGGLAVYNEYLQNLAHDKIIDYHWIMGYLIPSLIGLAWSGLELGHKFFPGINDTFDPKDILAYWLGIGVACGIDKIRENKKINEQFKTLK